jgi:hypothetical protein
MCDTYTMMLHFGNETVCILYLVGTTCLVNCVAAADSSSETKLKSHSRDIIFRQCYLHDAA